MTDHQSMPSASAGPLRNPLVSGVLGLVVGAVLVGVVALALHSGGSSTATTKGSAAALHAPATLGGLQPMAGLLHSTGSSGSGATAADMTADEARSSQRLSEAYGGAPAVVQEYSDAGLSNFAILQAVRADSPGVYVPFENPAELGVVRPNDQLITVGPVSCVIANEPTPVGQTPSATSVNVTSCQRTGSGLTVTIRPGGGSDLQHSPEQVAALANAAWSALS